MEALLRQLRERELPEETVKALNDGVDQVNGDFSSDKALKKQLIKTLSQLLRVLEKKHKIVAKNHYRNLWIGLGMAAFGLPIGMAFGTALGNLTFIGMGLPLGGAIGLALGVGMDRKAMKEGRQLDLEID